jgi:hypothetical protein
VVRFKVFKHISYQLNPVFIVLLSFISGIVVFIFIRNLMPLQDIFTQILAVTFVIFSLNFLALLFISYSRWQINFLISITISLIFLVFSQAQVLNIDRSRSFYVLSWVDQEIITLDGSEIGFDRICSSEMNNPQAIQMRLVEQDARGFVIQSGPNLRLTVLGNLQLFLAEKFATVFNLRNWFENTCND